MAANESKELHKIKPKLTNQRLSKRTSASSAAARAGSAHLIYAATRPLQRRPFVRSRAQIDRWALEFECKQSKEAGASNGFPFVDRMELFICTEACDSDDAEAERAN